MFRDMINEPDVIRRILYIKRRYKNNNNYYMSISFYFIENGPVRLVLSISVLKLSLDIQKFLMCKVNLLS